MNPDQPSRDEIEARLTALLLGELPDDEARLLRWTISQDAELKKLHDRLQLTIGFVQATAKNPAEASGEKNVPLKLSDERRKKLLAHFKTPRPQPAKELFWLKRIEVPHLIPALVAVAIIALLAALLLPALSKAKNRTERARVANMTGYAAYANKLAASDQIVTDARAARQPSASPVVTTLPPEPVLAPPPPEIVLPQPNSTAEITLSLPPAASQSPGTAAITLPVGGVVEDQRLPGELALEQPRSQSSHGLPSQNAGAVNSFGGGGGFGGFGGGGKAAAETETSPANAIQNNATLAWDDSGTDRSLAENQPANYGSENHRIGPTDTAGPTVNFNFNAGNDLALNDAGQSAKLGYGLANDGSDFKGDVATAPNQTVSEERFYRNGVGESDVDKLSALGDAPAARRPVARTRSVSPPAPKASPAPSNATANDSFGSFDDSFNPPTAIGNIGLTLNGENTFSDETVVNSGTLSGQGDSLNLGVEKPSDRDQAVVVFNTKNADPQQVAAELKNLFQSGSSSIASPSSQNSALQQRSQTAATAIGGAGTVGGTVLNNGTLNSANISLDPVTHNVIVIADKETAGQIRQTLASLDTTANTPPGNAGQFALTATNAISNTFAVNGGKFYFGLTKDDAAGLRYLAVNGNSTSAAPAPTLDADTLSIIHQEMLDRERLYMERLVQLQSLQAIQQTNSAAFREILPEIFPDSELSSLLKQLHEAQRAMASMKTGYSADNSIANREQAHVDVLNKQINDRVGGIMAALAADVSAKKASLDSLKPKPVAPQADQPLPKPPANAPVPQPEILTRENNFSTFSLNVSDVSFKLAAASLEKGQMPDAASIRSEEFINAFDYRDPEAKWDSPSSLSAQTGKMPVRQPVAFASERARYPFEQNRDLLRFSIKTAAAGRAANRPLNLVLLLDNSGSMERADRVAIIREALRVLATQLHPQDTVSVVTFARTARLWADGVSGDKAGETLSQVGGITPEGGTNLEEAMRLAYETARRHYLANGINRVVLLTDGAANLGNVDATVLKQKVEAQRKQGIALDCFGIGWEDYNDDLLEQLSGNGDGRYAFLNSPEDAAKDFAAKLAGALQVAAEDVKVQVEFNPQRVTSWRQIGYAKHQLTKEQFRDNSVLAAEIAAQEAANALYTVETKPDGTGPIATVRVRYKIPGTMDVHEHEWEVPYTGSAVSLKQSSAAMRLAATASAFSEWLAASPFAQEVTSDQLLNDLNGVPQIYGADPRPKQLETMIREAKSLSGK